MIWKKMVSPRMFSLRVPSDFRATASAFLLSSVRRPPWWKGEKILCRLFLCRLYSLRVLVFCRSCFIIDEVMAVVTTMAHWNKVSTASPYLETFDVGEGTVRMGTAKFVGSIRILIIGVSIMGSSWLDFDATTLTSSLGLLHAKV